MQKIIEEKLNPQDRGLCLMVQSILQKEVTPKMGDDHYFFTADYSARNEPEFILALYDAICGKIGERLIKIEDDPDAQRLVVYVKFGEGKAPRSYYDDADDSVGEIWKNGDKKCVALQFTGDNAEQMSKFLGGGVRQTLGGKPVFSFLNALAIIKHINIGDYARKVADGLYEITPADVFTSIWSK